MASTAAPGPSWYAVRTLPRGRLGLADRALGLGDGPLVVDHADPAVAGPALEAPVAFEQVVEAGA